MRAKARQWSRAAFTMAALLASLPVAGRLIYGEWGFEGAAGLAALLAFAGGYLRLAGGRPFRRVPDSAEMLNRAIQLARAGKSERAEATLTQAWALDPQLWQALQYRGEIRLSQQRFNDALQDFELAMRLAPGEDHLRVLRQVAAAAESAPRSELAPD